MTNKKTDHDVIVIGGGPGGYVAAIRASQLGLSVAVIEKENMGGICLNWGCIPTKALLRTAEIKHLIDNASDFGLKVANASVDLDAVVTRSRNVAKQLSSGIGHLMKKNKVDVFMTAASLGGVTQGLREVILEDKKVLRAKNIILATGARARSLPGIDANGDTIVTYRDAMTPKTMPKSLIVVGSGAIGMEFASFYADLGVDVTVLEAVDRILPAEDKEISAFAMKSFTERGIKIKTGVMLKGVTSSKSGIVATIEEKSQKVELSADRMILAVGIAANTENLGLEKTKIKLDRGHVVTSGNMQTDEAGVYAIGDMTGAPWLAHKASHEGIIAAESIAATGSKNETSHGVDRNMIPGCTYCRPQIASVGMTEQDALDGGYDIKVGRFPFLANGKAIALGDDNGMIKTIFDKKSGALLGAHMIGPEVTELIQGYVIAMQLETTEEDLMHTIFPHPTLSEAMHESVLDAFDKALHF